jgi:TonB family protein
MSTPTERWKNWEGRLVDGKFPLRQWLGSSDHSAVFFTERSGTAPQKSVIKLTAAENLDANLQLARWSATAKLTNPHLIQLFEHGQCEIDGTPVLYVVMEYAEENLAEIIPVRPLTSDEALEMLRPAADALFPLHEFGFVHGRIKPSNIMAVDNQLKLSSDEIRKTSEPSRPQSLDAYSAPELAQVIPTSASDIWSLGVTLLAVLTQQEPNPGDNVPQPISLPETIPQPLRGILQRCLQVDPAKRCTAKEIRQQLSPQPQLRPLAVSQTPAREMAPATRSSRWMWIPLVVAALVAVLWTGSKFNRHQNRASIPEVPREAPQPGTPSANSSAPFSAKPVASQNGVVQGSVLRQVMPKVSRNALHTITGRIKIGVEVGVDASGSVTGTKLISPGPSRYFSERSLTAARQWKFNPAQVNGQPASSEWIVRFQFARPGVQVFPAEKKP